MEIEFSKHAIEQLKIRSRITKAMVIETLISTDESMRSYRGRRVYSKKYGEEYLEVVVVKEDNKFTVITQYFLEQ